MKSSTKSYSLYSALFLAINCIVVSTAASGRGGEGFHNQGGFGGYHPNQEYHSNNIYPRGNEYHDGNNYYGNPGVGNYNPGNGWVAPTVVIDSNETSTCQSIQQCDSDGNCVQTQECN